MKTAEGLVTGDGRTHVDNEFMRESLVSHALNDRVQSQAGEEVSLLPWAKFVNIGGGSIMDKGAEAILPLLDELRALRKEHHFILSVGGGVRARHTFQIAMDLGLPTGGLAQVAGAVEEQNSTIVHALLSQHGGISMCREHFSELPKYLLTGMTPIVISMPPYHFWEPPAREGVLPENGSDLGAFMTAEVLGVNQMVFIKDREGQFSRNPAHHADATLIEECHVKDLIDLPRGDLILERTVLEALNRARHVRSINVVNGLERGAVSKAFAGEKVGTLIHQDPKS